MAKKAQTYSFETFTAVAIFMLILIFFISLIVTREDASEINEELETAVDTLISLDYFADGELTDTEMLALTSMTCDELKDLFSTENAVCVYFKDQDGNLIDISNNPTENHYGFGCPGLNISGKSCGFSN